MFYAGGLDGGAGFVDAGFDLGMPLAAGAFGGWVRRAIGGALGGEKGHTA